MSAAKGDARRGRRDVLRQEVDLLTDEWSVVLAIPISGPGFALRFAVRVGESPDR